MKFIFGIIYFLKVFVYFNGGQMLSCLEVEKNLLILGGYGVRKQSLGIIKKEGYSVYLRFLFRIGGGLYFWSKSDFL